MNKKAFTLLEVLIAMMIMTSGIIVLVNAWGGSSGRLKKTQINIEIAALLERKLVEIDMKYRGKSVDSIPEEEEDDFEGTDYSWKLTSKEFTMPDISSILVGKDGGANELMLTMMKQFSEHLSKSIKEVTVTVIYKGAKKPLSASVTLFFVDQNKELSLGALGALGQGG